MLFRSDRTGCPARAWLLCAIFTLMLFCHLPNSNGEIPVAVQTGQIPDISKFKYWSNPTGKTRQKNLPVGATQPRVLEMSSHTWFCSRNQNSWCHAVMCDQRQTPSTQIYVKDRIPRHLHLLPRHLKLKLLMKMKTNVETVRTEQYNSVSLG